MLRCEYTFYGKCKKHKYLYEYEGHLYCAKHCQIMMGTMLEARIYPYTHQGTPVCHHIGCKSERVEWNHGGFFCSKHMKELDIIRMKAHCGDKDEELKAHIDEFSIRKNPSQGHSDYILAGTDLRR